MAEKQYHTFISKITKTSPYGFQLAETGEESWINYGKFYEGNKQFEVGQELVVSCTESNGKYYVNKIEQSNGKASSPAIQDLVDDANNLELTRNTTQMAIIKQSCLKVALDYHVKISEHSDTSTEEDVIKSAEKFVNWVVSK